MKGNPYTMQTRPGSLIEAARGAKSMKAKKAVMKAAGIKTSGMFQGKSNALGHGGRAAQLKARGVPGGVIGNLARAAQAAPGQKNYHGHKAKHSAKKGTKMTRAAEMAMKPSHKKHKSAGSVVHHHIHVHGKVSGPIHVHMKGSDALIGTALENKERNAKRYKGHMNVVEDGSKHGDESIQGSAEEAREEGAKHFKKAKKHSSAAIKGMKEFMSEEAKEKKSHKCKGSACKHASHKRSKKA